MPRDQANALSPSLQSPVILIASLSIGPVQFILSIGIKTYQAGFLCLAIARTPFLRCAADRQSELEIRR